MLARSSTNNQSRELEGGPLTSMLALRRVIGRIELAVEAVGCVQGMQRRAARLQDVR